MAMSTKTVIIERDAETRAQNCFFDFINSNITNYFNFYDVNFNLG